MFTTNTAAIAIARYGQGHLTTELTTRDSRANITFPTREDHRIRSNRWPQTYIQLPPIFTFAPMRFDAMKQLIADVTRPSLIETGCRIYHWSQGAEDPTQFLLYMEWQDKVSFEAHVAKMHVKEAERRLTHEKMLVRPYREWHFVRLTP